MLSGLLEVLLNDVVGIYRVVFVPIYHIFCARSSGEVNTQYFTKAY